MSVIVWTGDHNKSNAERLRLANNLAVDVPIDSNIYNALDLGRFPKNSAHPKYVVVPAQNLFLAVGPGLPPLRRCPEVVARHVLHTLCGNNSTKQYDPRIGRAVRHRGKPAQL
jgi:hypothetical protein